MSKQPKFTPGPWVLNGVNSKGENIICSSDDEYDPWEIAITCRDCGYPEDRSEANSHLIVASPDLYTLCELVYDSFSGGLVMTFSEKDVEQFRAALAKARGEV